MRLIIKTFGLAGLDMAQTLNGYVYHTKYDRFNLIPRRTYQLTGENILALVKALANAEELENPSVGSSKNLCKKSIVFNKKSTNFRNTPRDT